MTDFQLIIPTRDSASWIGIIYKYYSLLGINPLYIVDSRSVDDTSKILRSLNANFIEYLPSGDFAEAGMLEVGAIHAQSNWILRLDDDEFPSKSMLSWIKGIGVKSYNQVWYFSRRELFLRNNSYFYSRSLGRYTHFLRPYMLSPHDRLFHRDRIHYVREVHTSGIVAEHFVGFAPEDAFFIHFNCLLRSPTERIEKVKKYESIKLHSTLRALDEYLPELYDNVVHNAGEDGILEFEKLLTDIPIYINQALPSFTEQEMKIIHDEMTTYHNEHKAYRERNIPKIYDADSISFLHYFPKKYWKNIAELIWTVGGKNQIELGNAIINYSNHFDSNGALIAKNFRAKQ